MFNVFILGYDSCIQLIYKYKVCIQYRYNPLTFLGSFSLLKPCVGAFRSFTHGFQVGIYPPSNPVCRHIFQNPEFRHHSTPMFHSHHRLRKRNNRKCLSNIIAILIIQHLEKFHLGAEKNVFTELRKHMTLSFILKILMCT